MASNSTTMIAQGRHRGGRGRAIWSTVFVINGPIRGAIMARGSIRVEYEDGSKKHIKGEFSLERWSGNPTRHRIAYNGFLVGTQADVAGVIPLPLSDWTCAATKGISDNMKGRLLRMEFNGNDTDERLLSDQLLIPTLTGGNHAAKMVVEAFVSANIKQCGVRSSTEAHQLVDNED